MEGDPLTVLSIGSGVVVERPSSGVGSLGEDARTLSSHSHTLYYAGGRKLVSFDLIGRTAVWIEQFGDDPQGRFAGQAIAANVALALTPDETSILVADSYNLGTWGVAILDVTSRNATGFLERLRVRRMFTIQPGDFLGEGGVLALGTRQEKTVWEDDTERRRGQLYLLAGNPLAIRDSIRFLSSADSLAGGVAEMIVDKAGEYIYFVTYGGRLYKYDLRARAYVASVRLPAYGPLAISPDGSSIYLIDATQSRDVPGSGFMYVADASLSAAQAIDLNSAAREGLPPQLTSVAVSADGSLVYVGAGTASRGPLYGVQHGSVIAVDTRTRSIKQIFSLPTWGVRSILPL
jgi:DNA-binding beta-propeller fold protein YncE